MDACEQTLESVKQHFDGSPAFNSNGGYVVVSVRGKNGYWNTRVKVESDLAVFRCVAQCPVNVPEDRRREMSEYMAHANNDLLFGSLLMDYESGDLRVQFNVPIGEIGLVPSDIERITWIADEILNENLPAIQRVIAGMSAQEAFNLNSKKQDDNEPEARGFWQRLGETGKGDKGEEK